MTSRSRAILNVNLDAVMANDPLRELFEACKTGDIAKVKKLITPQTVNARDTAGRKSTPLHFAAVTGPFYNLLCFFSYHSAAQDHNIAADDANMET
ncbi:hypothetical protein FF38_04736 [Lucilia cuprina]|uniref:Uncharacterized protein n=1 Tax=Lucilia cuprina TaxID=7375 RepID=A0A0L0CS41_LUCCU|nr:hypothetical protein FF38_04736 [Lucilia cuprina]